MEMIISKLMVLLLYFYFMQVSNVVLPLFNSVKKVHLFKVFKKTTRFKKYRKYVTGFVMNRRRYIIRKKRTRFQYLFNSAAAWGSVYRRLRQVSRFLQNVNILAGTLTFSHARFIEKVTISTFYKPTETPIPQFASISKPIFFNNSLFTQPNEIFFRRTSLSSQVGFIATDPQELNFLDLTQSGLFIHDFNFLTTLWSTTTTQQQSVTNHFSTVFLKHILTFVKQVRQLLV